MADFKPNPTQKKMLIALITHVKANPGAPFDYFKPSSVKGLADAGLLLANPAMVQNDKTAFALSEAGAALATKLSETPTRERAPSVPVDLKSITSIEVGGFTPKEKGRGGRQGSMYPFDTVEMGSNGKTGGFFIPATEADKEPWSRLVGTVNAYNRRQIKLKETNADHPVREFGVQEYAHSGTPGAFVYRVK